MESNPRPPNAHDEQQQQVLLNDDDAVPARKQGDRVMVCGQDGQGGKTYRTATIAMVRRKQGLAFPCVKLSWDTACLLFVGVFLL